MPIFKLMLRPNTIFDHDLYHSYIHSYIHIVVIYCLVVFVQSPPPKWKKAYGKNIVFVFRQVWLLLLLVPCGSLNLGIHVSGNLSSSGEEFLFYFSSSSTLIFLNSIFGELSSFCGEVNNFSYFSNKSNPASFIVTSSSQQWMQSSFLHCNIYISQQKEKQSSFLHWTLCDAFGNR